ncbi:MAG: hypothetical protein ACYTG5_22745 [Planctomycetota bacterium]|jgi:hypothetical protein
METIERDRQLIVREVIEAVQHVHRQRKDQDHANWAAEQAMPLSTARELLGGFGEGRALSQVVALCTELLQWPDLHEVGVNPMSDPPWKVLQEDLLEPDDWSDGVRRGRVLKILRKLAQKLEHLAGEELGDGQYTNIIDFCAERGVVAETLRNRLHRHNEKVSRAKAIRPQGFGMNHRMQYRREELMSLLTEEERARCR